MKGAIRTVRRGGAQPSPLSADVLKDFHNIPSLVEQLKQLKINHDDQLQAIHDAFKADSGQSIADHKSAIKKLEDKSSALIQEIVSRATDTLQTLAQKGEEIKFVQKGNDGAPGDPGYTPQAGVDFYTEQEKQDFLTQVAALIKNGEDGEDADPQTVVDYILKNGLIKVEHIAGLDEKIATIRRASALGGMHGGGDTIKAGTNVTISRDVNGKTVINASGGGGTVYTETPTGNVDGSNKTYTTVHTINTVFGLWINGEFIHDSEYTVSGAGFTMGTALPSSLSGTGFTIKYS